MSIIAIDPGPTQSAVVDYDPHRKIVLESRIEDNETVLKWLRHPRNFKPSPLVIEMIGHYGMPVGKDVFETCVWIGRFIEAWGPGWELLPRPQIKLHLCGSARAKDGNVRQALLDKFGGEKACEGPVKLSKSQREALSALSRSSGLYTPKIRVDTFLSLERRNFAKTVDGSSFKSFAQWEITDAGRDALAGKCGPLYGMASHKWSALAVAVTWAETHPNVQVVSFALERLRNGTL